MKLQELKFLVLDELEHVYCIPLGFYGMHTSPPCAFKFMLVIVNRLRAVVNGPMIAPSPSIAWRCH